MEHLETRIATMAVEMKQIKTDITDIKSSLKELACKMDDKYVTKEEVKLLKTIVYGLCGLILTAVAVAIIRLIIQ